MKFKLFIFATLFLLISIVNASPGEVWDISLIPEQVHITLADRPDSILARERRSLFEADTLAFQKRCIAVILRRPMSREKVPVAIIREERS